MWEYEGQDRIPDSSPDRSESQQVLRRLPVLSERSERQTPQETELLRYQDQSQGSCSLHRLDSWN